MPGTQPKDYRPIALTSSICNLLERMIKFRLMWYYEPKSILSPSQFGFRCARNTAEPIAPLTLIHLLPFLLVRNPSWVFSLILEKPMIPLGDITSSTNYAPLMFTGAWEFSSDAFSPIVLSG